MGKEIALITSIFSLLGTFWIFWRKIPLLLSLPNEKPESFFGKILKKCKERILKTKFFQFSFWLLFSEKILKRIRILSLKVDNFTFNLSRKLKEKTKEEEKDDFWDKIKEEIKKNKKDEPA